MTNKGASGVVAVSISSPVQTERSEVLIKSYLTQHPVASARWGAPGAEQTQSNNRAVFVILLFL